MHENVSTREAPALVNVLQTRPLQFSTSDINVVPATPVKRRGKCMSRRTGQDGHIEASGKWWVVRWWMDVEGQEARRHMRAKICPISGPGHLSKSERERRAREIVAESGADTVERFNKVVKQAQGVTFHEQAKWWLDHIQRRKRKPIAPATLESTIARSKSLSLKCRTVGCPQRPDQKIQVLHICRLGTRPLSRKCHARCGKAPQFSKQKRRRAEKVVCSDLLQPSDFPQLALALARFCKSDFPATNQKVGSSSLSGRATLPQ